MSQLENVNTTDIRAAIRLGCRTMSHVFNADDNDIPFFGSQVRPEARLSFSPAHSEAHVPGRHLNALLNAEATIGITLDETVIDKHAQATFFSYSGPVPLPLNRQTLAGPLVNFLPHNVREGFHALYALTKYRHSHQARKLAEESIAAILALWEPLKEWDLDQLEGQYGLHVWPSTYIVGLARAIGPLVKLYQATDDTTALDLALILKEKVLAGFFPEDGAYDVERLGAHTHSTTCVMSSLAQLADLTADGPLMQRVQAFYDNGLWVIRDALGWCIESADPAKNPDRGEVNNTGDILETALILGRWGYSDYYHDAERILRGHLLPAQLRDPTFIINPPNPDHEDGKRDVAERHVGAFGFPAPYGHAPVDLPVISFNMDIVGGAVGSLCEAYRAVTRYDQAGHWVNLLFDHETDAIQVESPYTHPALRVRVKRPGPLFVRLPPWAPKERMTITGAGEARYLANGYLFFPRPPRNRFVSINLSLPSQEITLRHRTRDIHVRLRGDSVVAMDNFGTDLTFFDPF